MMKNETKQDVFEVAMNHAAKSGWIDYGEMMSRYAAALPDDLPVIPKDIAYVIEQAKNGDYKLGWVFNAAYLGIWQFSVGNWIRTYADTFARAWIDGYQVEDND